MAKKRKRRAGPTAENPLGLKRTSGLLRHTNSQTMAAAATTEVGEAITNPAFGRGGVHTGMEIVRMLLIPGPLALTYGGAVLSGHFISQVQVGDQSAVPVLMPPTNEALFAHLHVISTLTTSGAAVGPIFPMNIPIINVVPIIVEQFFTVVHEAASHASYNDEIVHTVIDYFTVEVPDAVYTQIVLSRRDQS